MEPGTFSSRSIISGEFIVFVEASLQDASDSVSSMPDSSGDKTKPLVDGSPYFFL